MLPIASVQEWGRIDRIKTLPHLKMNICVIAAAQFCDGLSPFDAVALCHTHIRHIRVNGQQIARMSHNDNRHAFSAFGVYAVLLCRPISFILAACQFLSQHRCCVYNHFFKLAISTISTALVLLNHCASSCTFHLHGTHHTTLVWPSEFDGNCR